MSVFLSVCSVSLLGLVVAHVYLLSRGIMLSDLVTFWLPLELAAFLILFAVIYSEDNWVFVLIVVLVAALHLVSVVYTVPEFQTGSDAIYGYQVVLLTLETGRWTFGTGTGSGLLYSYFPMMFIFTSLWSGIGSIPPFLLTNYGLGLVNLASLLSIRMLCVTLLNFSKRQTNLVLFMYGLNPIIHQVEASFHYEAYAIIFYSLVLLYVLKPQLSASERIIAVISIIAISLSHYFTAYILLLNVVVLGVAYLIIKGTGVHFDLIFMAIVTPLALISSAAVAAFSAQTLQILSILSHVENVSSLLSRLLSLSRSATVNAATAATYLPAPWFGDLASLRNVLTLLLGLIAIFTLCVSISRRLRIRFKRRDMLTYLASAWLFSVFLAVTAYFGVAWNETTFASTGAGIAGFRIASFSFIQFSLFSGLSLSIVLERMDNYFRGRKFGPLKSDTLKVVLAVFLIIVFVSSAVVQAYPRITYESGYASNFYDEYPATFQEPVYLGTWWHAAANHTDAAYINTPLEAFVTGYGWQRYWEDNLTQPSVDLNNNTLSQYFTVYYAVDTLQVQKPSQVYNLTLNPEYVSSKSTKINTIFDTGRIMVLVKPLGV
jgi:hypothetical protein